MTESEKLTALKSTCCGMDNVPDDDVMTAYLNLAGEKIVNRCYPFKTGEDVPERYHQLQVEIACYLVAKRGAEGEVTHTEQGIQIQYEEASIPESMLRAVTPFAGVL